MLGVRPPATKTVLIMHSPVKRKKGKSDHRNGLSVKDIYLSVQQERPSLSRRQNIEYAQLYTMYGGAQTPRPDIISLPGSSRPHSTTRSVISRAHTVPDIALRNMAESDIDADEDESRCVTSMSAKTSNTFCRRIKSAVDREVEGLVSSLSRQCCDVLGPRACHECNVVNRRHSDHHRHMPTAGYDNLHHSGDNFATSILVSRMMPGVPEYIVQTKVACGEIRREGFKDKMTRRVTGDPPEGYIVNEIQNTPKHKLARTSSTFFTSIRDLNTKLVAGSTPSHVAVQQETPPDKDDKTFTEKMCPSFISPKKVQNQSPSFTAMYEPPLLPKVRQNVEPAFFAGSSGSYKLPDRLPEKIFSDQESNENTPAMSRMSTNYSIASTQSFH